MTTTRVPAHPAKFSDNILAEIGRALHEHGAPADVVLLDPFAGIGKVHKLAEAWTTVGIEIEPEWAAAHPRTWCGDSTNPAAWRAALDLVGARAVDAIVTSPVYGNRMSDHHDAKDPSKRHTYRHYLGRELDENNAGRMQYRGETAGGSSARYAELHRTVYEVGAGFVVPGGLVVVNVSDHVRAGEVVPVVDAHRRWLADAGFVFVEERKLGTRRHRHGENHDARVSSESILIFRAP